MHLTLLKLSNQYGDVRSWFCLVLPDSMSTLVLLADNDCYHDDDDYYYYYYDGVWSRTTGFLPETSKPQALNTNDQ